MKDRKTILIIIGFLVVALTLMGLVGSGRGNPGSNRAYIPNENSNTVSGIDTSTNNVIAVMNVGSGPL